MPNKLKLTVKQLRGMQEKHGISNLLNPGEDAPKVASLDFLTDAYYEGSRRWETPPTKEDIEELEFGDLVGPVKAFLSGESGGNG